MPLGRLQRMPTEKRERLLTVAAQLFATHGYEAASLNHILGEAQIGKSSAYYYFEDKADLFCTVVLACLDQLGLAPTPAEVASLSAANFWSVFAGVHDRPFAQSHDQPWRFGALRAAEHLTAESLRHPALARLTVHLADYMMEHMGQMLARGQALGVIRRDLPLPLLLAWFRALDAATDDWLLAHAHASDADTVQHVARSTVAAIQHALSPPETTSSSIL